MAFPRNLLAIGATNITAAIETSVINATAKSGNFENSADLKIKAKAAVAEIDIIEVPIAILIGIERNPTSTGTKRIPPPIPSKPVKKPMAEASERTKSFDGCMSGSAGITGPRSIEIPA